VYTLMHEIAFKPSRLLGLLQLGGVALAVSATLMADVPGAVQWALGVAVCGWGVWVWRQSRCMETLRLTADGQVQCRNEQGEWGEAGVLGDSFVSPVLMVLRYHLPAGRVRALTLLPDSAHADDLRRLRVSLRWARRTRSGTSSLDGD
jgi:toxin CptA